jgi:hypothetical protein
MPSPIFPTTRALHLRPMMLLIITGCPPNPAGTASEATSSTSASAGTEQPMTGGTQPTSGTTSSGSSDGTSFSSAVSVTSEGSSNDASSSGHENTGGGSGQLLPEDFCQDACAYLLACESALAQDLSSCVDKCVTAAFSDKPGCFDAAAGWWSCLTETTCDGVKIVPAGGCDSYYANYFSMCGNCDTAVGYDGIEMCSAILSCPEIPPLSFACSGSTCTCRLEGLNPFVECPAMDLCATDDATIVAAADDCCNVKF